MYQHSSFPGVHESANGNVCFSSGFTSFFVQLRWLCKNFLGDCLVFIQHISLHLDSYAAQWTDRDRYSMSPASYQDLTEGNWMLHRTVFRGHRSRHILSDLGRKIFLGWIWPKISGGLESLRTF